MFTIFINFGLNKNKWIKSYGYHMKIKVYAKTVSYRGSEGTHVSV